MYNLVGPIDVGRLVSMGCFIDGPISVIAREKASMRSANFHSLTEAPRLVSYVPRL